MKSKRIVSLIAAAGLIALPVGALADTATTGTATSTSSTTSSGSTSGGTTSVTGTTTNSDSTTGAGTASGDADSDTSSSTSSTTSTTIAAPAITTQPASVVVDAGSTATLSVTATGGGTLHYLWLRNGRPLWGTDSATLSITQASVEDAGLYSVLIANDGGRVISQPAAVDVNVVAGTIATAPQNQTVNAGTDATFSIATSGTGLTYQWRHDGHAIASGTNAALTVSNPGALSDGAYSVVVSNSAGVAAVAAATLTVHTDARLTNISTRGHVGAADDQLIIGFVIRGQGSKQVLLRAVGPTLASQFGVTDALSAPQLTLHGYSHHQLITDTNTGWDGSAAETQAFAQVGAFPLPTGSADAALLESLDRGAFSAVVSGVNGASGVALAEAYDADTGSPSAELVNISARARVGAEAANTLIAGFTISGTTSDTVLIRGVGPTLAQFGLHGVLDAAQVTLYDAKGNQIAVNTGWGMNSRTGDEDTEKEDSMDAANDRVGAFHLERRSRDAALLVTLPPGIYTAHLTGVHQATGIGMIEIYEVR